MRHAVWVIGHGSNKIDWVQLVHQCVSEMHSTLPVVTSFLEMVEGHLIPDGLRRLEKMNVTEVQVIPFFVSSGSSHIEEIQYLLGLLEDLPFAARYAPLAHSLNLKFGRPMDDHPLILEIILERLAVLSQNPLEELAVLAAHGSDLPHLEPRMEEIMRRMVKAVKERVPFAGVYHATKHPDTLRQTVLKLNETHPEKRVLVQPLFLAEGFFTRHVIPSALEGLHYVYKGETYLPHPNVARWLNESAEAVDKGPSYEELEEQKEGKKRRA